MAATFNSSAQVLSIGIFFTLMILGLSATLPSTLYHGLVAQGVAGRHRGAGLAPPAGGLAVRRVLGLQPDGHAARARTPCTTMAPAQVHYITGRSFFPNLIAGPFGQGLKKAFDFAAVVCLLGAVASLLRGGKFHYTEPDGEAPPVESAEQAVAETEPLLVELRAMGRSVDVSGGAGAARARRRPGCPTPDCGSAMPRPGPVCPPARCATTRSSDS